MSSNLSAFYIKLLKASAEEGEAGLNDKKVFSTDCSKIVSIFRKFFEFVIRCLKYRYKKMLYQVSWVLNYASRCEDVLRSGGIV
jgi:hypothetical protein